MLDANLKKELKAHQIEGYDFLLNNCFVGDPKGCVLAHSMGLGKTVTTIALIHSALTIYDAKKVLIVCPKSTIPNWMMELKTWFEKCHRNRKILTVDVSE